MVYNPNTLLSVGIQPQKYHPTNRDFKRVVGIFFIAQKH